jgi:mannosyl-oligosaccharide glucosidase
MEVIFESDSFASRSQRLSGGIFSEVFKKYSDSFDKKFEEKFPLKSKGFNEEEAGFAQAALSNMIGGIGYFYGKSRVLSRHLKEPVDYWESPLYTGVPSRPFFPRGFLWDEGFHQLLISQWDTDISMDIIGHWLDLMNIEGWIPREQILGDEARTKVPGEFVTQHNENANPPTLILPIKSMIDKGVLDKDYLVKIFPRLKAWFNWFNTTQLGSLPSIYRWHGRDAKTDRELNPKTLTSGLDDYPRSSHPTDDERHIDLRCWMAYAAGLMADIAKAVGKDPEPYRATNAYLSDATILDKYHWSPKAQMYSDYGNHTKLVKLVHRSTQPGGPTRLVRVVTSRTGPVERFVNSFGYVSLFPFLLQILKPDSPKLDKVLTDMRNAELLWTEYGLRSLSKSDPLYKKYNTEHDGPYWRGSIWININYLSVKALHYYGHIDGPYQSKANSMYKELRRNLITNIFRQYHSSGFIWEQYDDETGHGKGSHPFTGWSSLVVLMMSEQY